MSRTLNNLTRSVSTATLMLALVTSVSAQTPPASTANTSASTGISPPQNFTSAEIALDDARRTCAIGAYTWIEVTQSGVTWQYACGLSEISAANPLRRGCSGDQTRVVTIQQDGQVFNVCRTLQSS